MAAPASGGLRLVAVNRAAAAEGLAPGMTLADARALVPALSVVAADLAGDAAALARLAQWCLWASPRAAVDGADGLILEVTGCAHLFAGEEALLARLLGRLRDRGLTVRGALADSLGAAWALARFGEGDAVVPPGGAAAALADLPPAALRLTAETAAALEGLGVRRIADLAALPRAGLAARFGAALGRRLDQAFGRIDEPLAPVRPAPPYLVRRVLTEPLAHHAGITGALAVMLAELADRLAAEGRGARRLELVLFGLDHAVHRLGVGTVRASRDAAHLAGLLAPRLDGLDLGLGVEAMTLAAPETEPLAPRQGALTDEAPEAGLAALVDRLVNHLGAAAVFRPLPRPSHVPERASHLAPPLAPAEGVRWRDDVVRPVHLFPRPEPVEAVAMVPDAPPVWFRWRRRTHRVRAAEGPERIACEWWRAAPGEDDAFRDYYRIEDLAGARFWLYREGAYGEGARWYLHGLFA